MSVFPRRFLILVLVPCMSMHALEGSQRSEINAAFALLSAKQYEQAIIAYESLTNHYPDTPEAYFNLGIAYFHTHRFSSAQTAFERAIVLKSEDPVFQSEAVYNIGNCLFRQASLFYTENPERARIYLVESVRAFENAVELSFDFEAARYNLSTAKSILEDWESSAPDGPAGSEDTEGPESPDPSDADSTEEKNEVSDEASNQASGSDSRPNTPGSSDSEAKPVESGGGLRGETMETREALMLLDSLELNEQRITLSRLMDEKEKPADNSPNW